MKKLTVVFAALALILSHLMCAHVAYSYSSMLCCIEHMGCSAPANVAFLYAIPYLAGIAVCVVLAIVFRRKSRK